MWIGAQAFFGFALGCGFQQTNIAVQAVLPKEDAPVGISLAFFSLTLGPTIFIAVCQNVLDNHLIKNLSGLNGSAPHQILNTGATQLRHVFSAADLPRVLQVYNEAIVQVFYVGVAVSSFTILGALTVANKSVKKAKAKPAEGQIVDEEQSAETKEMGPGRRSIDDANSERSS